MNIDLVRQSGNMDCGVACLTMIANYFGHHLTLTDLSAHFNIQPTGVTAKDIAQVARSLNLDVKAYQLEVSQLPLITPPAIAHVRSHYVVIDGCTSDAIRIADPASGWNTLTYRQFRGMFSKVVLTFRHKIIPMN